MAESRQLSGWVGWIGFAAFILILSGLFSIIQGSIALIGSNYYYAVGNGTLFLFDLTGWGWWNLIIGVVLTLTGFALFSGATWARIVAIIAAGLSAIGQLLLVPAQPWWAIIVIAIDVLVIYAITAHGRELQASGE
ncbi:hypothetical protein [Agromyces sp. Leaf222]|uniref:DUF7144 family membrane protein n=1 Tax=Agromyces sp. Leaf222 TaxID=1735688 RepID=UPI0006FEA7CE|nr:hypothetical protein [Agromyces sp. Leaf222]KQM82903.1 hypothetical protein ASE68_06240 [Agromyces sp. Leaf222]